MRNEMKLEFDSLSINEGFARIAVAGFITPLNPTLEEMSDLKTAVSEAVTNAIIHGYGGACEKIILECIIDENTVAVTITDFGRGIADIHQAMEPLFTTRPDLERSGMGFAFMEAFMDELHVESLPGEGTSIHMKKRIGMNCEVKQMLKEME